ncbi:ExeM/NucH family extracellular endonuclease [Enterovibrio sp. ZSDZ35]|uniref:ExeM/NucH family extracellular endonuclease n=1 Tax=Enterovibrio qingdaonensis TaxID=2899818 RepID=A0ABT5QNR5_9GAMM|nr:ExeM/NucH family extracellular endonuclease [Enterovibrio sp. ZSDZ35]MDD1782130.1 ExeM/NucH family extracellular endonuclease [Enterovibrio sp. ZSDZ35]
MKISTWSPLALALSTAFPASADILITEYVEGSSNNKAIELTNTGGADASLDGLFIKVASNGNTSFNGSVSLSGTLPAGDSYVVANSSAASDILDVAQQTSGSVNFNGNDVVALVDASDNVLDGLGQLGNSDSFGANVTLRRTEGSGARTDLSSAFNASEQWQSFASDTFDGLGCSGIGACDGGGGGNTFSCEGETLTPTYAIQGSGDRSPLVPDGSFEAEGTYYVEGIVTAVTTSLYKGFWLQDAIGDGDGATSDGLFIFTGNAPDGIAPGMQVCVAGTVKEFFNLTELDASDKKWEVIDTVDLLPVTDIEVGENETLDQALERYEGMKVRLTQESELVVTRNFGFDFDAFRNNMVLSHAAPNFKPTQRYIAGSDEAASLAAANDANQLFIETDQKAPNGVIPYFPGLDADQGYIRIGDTVTNLEGVLGYSFSDYRLVVTNELVASDFVRDGDRTAAPENVAEANIKVASFNVLNYFTSASAIGGDLNVTCDDQADADASRGCNRGTKDAAEFTLQQAKIVNALTAMDADIVGLMEIENNGFGENGALANLVTELNAQFPDEAQHYAYVVPANSDLTEGAYLGSDAIQVALIYRPAVVTLESDAVVVRMPEQHISGENPDGETRQLDKFQRDSLLQSFWVMGDQKLSVAVSHFKSKGSGCYEDWVAGEFEDDPADLQGRCNEFRVSAAETLGKALENLDGDIIALGDFNAYGKEDPMRVMTDYDTDTAVRKIVTAAGTSIAGVTLDETAREVGDGFGYVNLASYALGDEAFSYTFDGELGSLDHAVGNTSVVEKVVGVEDWHINSVESTLFQYSGRFTGDLVKSTNPYSSSDHDPVIVSLHYEEQVQHFKLRFKNKSFFWVQPVVNGEIDSDKPWLRWKSNRKYTEQSVFLQDLGVEYGDTVSLSVRLWGIFDIPCGSAEIDEKTVAVYKGFHCKIK